MKTFTSALLGATALTIVAFANAAPAEAHTKPCCYNNGGFFQSTPSTCYHYGGRVVDQRYCYRGGYYDNDYGQSYGYGYRDDDDWRYRQSHRRHDRDDWGRGRDRDDWGRGEGGEGGEGEHRRHRDGGEGEHSW